MNKEEFNHKISVTVRFNEVDMLGVCNNAVYINYFEHARLCYIKDTGLLPENGLFSDNLFFVVRNEIDYLSFAKYDDILDVYSKISFIKNSSYGFDHLVINSKTGAAVAEGKGILVQVDHKSKNPVPLQDEWINKIKSLEKNLKIFRE